jgi:predicted enzyme related to lactoylglutathione lyase
MTRRQLGLLATAAAFAPGDSAGAAPASTPDRNDGRIDYVEMTAADLPRAKTFFTAAFGWKFTDYGPDYTSFEDGRITGGFARGAARPGGALIVIKADELERAVDTVTAAGGRVVKPIFAFPGGRRFHFADPEGYEWAVWGN